MSGLQSRETGVFAGGTGRKRTRAHAGTTTLVPPSSSSPPVAGFRSVASLGTVTDVKRRDRRMFSLSECSTVAQASRSLGRAPRSARRCSAAPARPVSVRAEGSNNGSDGVFKDAKFGEDRAPKAPLGFGGCHSCLYSTHALRDGDAGIGG